MIGRRNVRLLVLIITSLIFISLHFEVYTFYSRLSPSSAETSNQSLIYPNFIAALKANAKLVKWNRSEMKFIILGMTDNSFTDVAINLYISSFKRFNIDNFLFVGGGSNACSSLIKHKIQCYDFWEDPDSNKPNNYGSKEFIRKMNIRTEMILQAIKAKYSVLHMDLDIIFLQNPLPEIEELLEKYDMAILWDYSSYNAGFLAIKANSYSERVYIKVQERTKKSELLDDQNALNRVLEETHQLGKVHALNSDRYLCGKSYYEQNRDFAPSDLTDNCPNCTVIHNNWIVSKEAKVHRFKETAMWYIDDDQYYSSVNRKYLLYYNPMLDIVTDFKNDEKLAFKTAFKIAAMLNRTLIIPRFHCKEMSQECPINSLFNVTKFHEEFFPNYRESSFLLNELVPRSISMKPFNGSITNCNQEVPKPLTTPTTCNKQNSSLELKCTPFKPIPILILTKINQHLWKSSPNMFSDHRKLDVSDNESIDESVIIDHFEGCSDQVLVLSSLIYVKVKFANQTKDELFDDKLSSGLVAANYSQM